MTVRIGGLPCSFLSDDSEEYLSALEQRANAVMKQTAPFAGPSARGNAILSVLFLTDVLLRKEQGEEPQAGEKAAARKATAKAPIRDRDQVSVWDLLETPAAPAAER